MAESQMGRKSPYSLFSLSLGVATIELQAESIYHGGMKVSLQIPPAFIIKQEHFQRAGFIYIRNILDIDSMLLAGR